MKILLFTDSLGAGGAQRQLVGLAVMLKERGYEIKVCTYHKIDFYKNYLDANNIVNELIPNANNTQKRILSIIRYFKKEKPDYIIAYQETPSLIACIAKLCNCRYKLIVSERNTTQKLGLNEKIRFFLYRYANHIVPNSYSQEKFLLSHYSWMKQKIQTISNFVDLNQFSFSTKTKSKTPLIVVAATIWPSKNVLGFIEAINILVHKNIVFKVEWYGIINDYKEYLDLCYDLIKRYNLQDYIQLLPKTQEIHEKYMNSDYFCLPSYYEGTPNVICEAMACGRPILCSNVCDNSIYVKDGNNGFLFNPQKPNDIAEKIYKALIITNEEYDTMCKNSRSKANELFSKELFISKYIDLLN